MQNIAATVRASVSAPQSAHVAKGGFTPKTHLRAWLAVRRFVKSAERIIYCVAEIKKLARIAAKSQRHRIFVSNAARLADVSNIV